MKSRPQIEKEKCPNRDNEQLHVPSLWQYEIWVAREEEIFTFPRCFFFSMIAPLNIKELDCLAPHDMILLIQDFDKMLKAGEVRLESCHF
jgi:hypothetical protein